MTTREVTVMSEETREVEVCDECGLGEDAAAGDLLEYSTRGREGAGRLHFHESCHPRSDELERPVSEVVADDPFYAGGAEPLLILERDDVGAGVLALFVSMVSVAAATAGLPVAGMTLAVMAAIVAGTVFIEGRRQADVGVFDDV